jgi:hypothetical protein
MAISNIVLLTREYEYYGTNSIMGRIAEATVSFQPFSFPLLCTSSARASSMSYTCVASVFIAVCFLVSTTVEVDLLLLSLDDEPDPSLLSFGFGFCKTDNLVLRIAPCQLDFHKWRHDRHSPQHGLDCWELIS